MSSIVFHIQIHILYQNKSVAGWFKTGIREPCYPDYRKGSVYQIRKANEPEYKNKNLVGLCPAAQAGCAEFQDPLGEAVWTEGFNLGTGVASGWNLWCGGGPGCSNVNVFAPSLSEEVDEVKEGWKSQKIKFNEGKQCRGKVNGDCITTDLGFSRVYAPYDLNLKSDTHYTLSVFGKVSDHTNSWYLMLREYYHSDLSENNQLACEKRNNNPKYPGYWVWTGSYCYHDLVSQRVKDTNWHQASLHLYINPLDFSKLFQIEVVIAGPRSGTVLYDWLTLQKYTSYYYLNNQKLDKSSCTGRVGLRDGCVLFYEPTNPLMTFNSTETYSKSQQTSLPDSLVTAVTCHPSDPGCDTNLILKVRRDRTCGEWLACATSRVVWDK